MEKDRKLHFGDAVISVGIRLEQLCSFWLAQLGPAETLSRKIRSSWTFLLQWHHSEMLCYSNVCWGKSLLPVQVAVAERVRSGRLPGLGPWFLCGLRMCWDTLHFAVPKRVFIKMQGLLGSWISKFIWNIFLVYRKHLILSMEVSFGFR